MTARVLDLTGSYTGLIFRGVVEISEDTDHCIYRFPDLEVELGPPPNASFEAAAVVQYICMVAFTAELPPARERRKTFVQRVPIDAALGAPGAAFRFRDIVFRPPRQAIADAEYAAFSLGGRSIRRSDDPMWRRAVPGGEMNRAVIWPMAARANLPGWTSPRFGYPIYRSPSDPNDCCAPEKIR